MKKTGKTRYYSVLAAVVLALLAAVIAFRVHVLEFFLQNEPVHSAMEAAGALIAIIISLVLLQRGEEGRKDKLYFPALGFLAMGILDMFHAVSSPGQAFVFSRSAAGLAGGLGFALVCAPPPPSRMRVNRYIPRTVAALALISGVWMFILPGHVPEMAVGGRFTPLASNINLLSGILYLTASICFFRDFRSSGVNESFMFGGMSLLFGFSSFTFRYSALWDDEWWLWHLTRLLAYALVVWVLFAEYRKTVSALEGAVGKLAREEKELKESNENLGREIESRRKTEEDLKKNIQKVEKSQKSMLYMVEDLNATKKELQREVSERKKAEEEIRRYATQLQGANQELEAFSYSVSHDLRAPLRSMDGFSRILLETYRDKLDDEGKDNLTRVRKASQRMAQLIEDILTLSHVSRKEIKKERVDLSKMAETVLSALKEQDPSREVESAVEPDLFAEGDAHLLRLVLENLLGNAWKFTSKKEGAKIEFAKTPDDKENVFLVRDNGAGFDMRYVDKLFGAFQRLHSEKEFLGTGIGLASVKRIVSRHGGRVWAEGDIGKGACFYFTLP